MASGRRHFILAEPAPVSELNTILGRVVEDKLLPMRSYAPVSPSSGGHSPPHNPSDIIPDILPKPTLWTNRSDFFSHTSDWSIAGGLSGLLGIEKSNEVERGISLESSELKSYSLTNAMNTFEKLMSNEHYALDVNELLKRSRRGHAYFVVGFLTTKGAMWKEFTSQSRRSGLEVTVPVLEAVGSPLGGIGDPHITPGFGTSERIERSMKIDDEVIFALAYDVIKGSRRLDLDAKAFLKRYVVNTGPKRAKARHLAFSPDEDSDDDDEIVDSDEEETELEIRGGTSGGIMYVDIKEFPAEELEDQNLSADSFKLRVGDD
jgi:hypothetical protein